MDDSWRDTFEVLDGGAAFFEGVNVLVVGDDEPFTRAVSDLLAAAGHRASMAFDARTAVTAARHRRADVVVCDLGAMQLQSVEVILALRELGDGAPSVVVVSAMPFVEAHCRALHVEHFLAQPFPFGALLELVERLGRQHQLTADLPSGVYRRDDCAEALDDLPDLDVFSLG